jgi:TetR/AcrR family transcriptional regulator, tetracycline repressor protein
MTRRAGRPRAGDELLTRERIVDAALAIVDAEGMAALSMRRLAAALGVDPMAIYRHLPNKQALIEALIARAFAALELPAPDDARPWQERVRAIAQAYRRLVRAHAHLIAYLTADSAWGGAAALDSNEALYGALLETGLPPQQLIYAADLIVDYVHGFVFAEVQKPAGETFDRRTFLAHLAAQPPARYPVQRRIFADLAAGGPADLPASFEAGIEVILAGIEALRPHDR